MELQCSLYLLDLFHFHNYCEIDCNVVWKYTHYRKLQHKKGEKKNLKFFKFPITSLQWFLFGLSIILLFLLMLYLWEKYQVFFLLFCLFCLVCWRTTYLMQVNVTFISMLPNWLLFVQSQQQKNQDNVWNLLKVNNKDTTTTSLTSFWCLYC